MAWKRSGVQVSYGPPNLLRPDVTSGRSGVLRQLADHTVHQNEILPNESVYQVHFGVRGVDFHNFHHPV